MSLGKGILCLAALLLLPPAPGFAATSGPQVIASVMKAYGGRAVVEQTRSVCAKGRIQAFAFNNAQGSYAYCVAPERRLRVDIDYGDFAEHRALDGATAYVQTGEGGAQVLTGGANYLSILYQYEQMNLPRTLLEQAERIRYQGRTSLGDEPVDVLVVEETEGMSMTVYVDAATGRIVKTTGHFGMGGMGMELSSVFSDFRNVGDTLLPFRFVNFASGEKIAETTIQSYRLNPPLADDSFRIPERAP